MCSSDLKAKVTKENIPSELIEALDDDLNTPVAFAVINKIAKSLANAKSDSEKVLYKSQLLSLGELLGLFLEDPEAWFQTNNDQVDVKKVEELISQREQARQNKDWALSDKIRDELTTMKVVIEDSADGTRWSVKK